jgi:hypothetical protein
MNIKIAIWNATPFGLVLIYQPSQHHIREESVLEGMSGHADHVLLQENSKEVLQIIIRVAPTRKSTYLCCVSLVCNGYSRISVSLCSEETAIVLCEPINRRQSQELERNMTFFSLSPIFPVSGLNRATAHAAVTLPWTFNAEIGSQGTHKFSPDV